MDSRGCYNFNKKYNSSGQKFESRDNLEYRQEGDRQGSYAGTVIFKKNGNEKLQKLKLENATLKDCLLRIEKDHQDDICYIDKALRN